MIIKSMNYVIATEEEAYTFLDADEFMKHVPNSLLAKIKEAQSEGKDYILVSEPVGMSYYDEKVLELQWG